jgi:hypothetical protein
LKHCRDGAKRRRNHFNAGTTGLPISRKPQRLNKGDWKTKLQEIIPSCGHSLIEDAALTRQVRADTAAVLGLQNV